VNVRKIQVVQNVLESSEALAGENRRRMDEANVLCVNLLSAPGSGKTTLLQQLLPSLGARRCAVLVGDLQTSRDAERLDGLGAQVVQINTGRGCHLSPGEVARGLAALDLAGLSFVFVENVGNMVCPAAFDLGEHLRVVLLSTPEGDDKVAKYPTLFQSAAAIVLNKTDLAELLGFRREQVREDLAQVNTAAPLFETAAREGQGIEALAEWLRQKRGAKDAPEGGMPEPNAEN
jgi:hydrogenase nickel incorporation protein HypB